MTEKKVVSQMIKRIKLKKMAVTMLMSASFVFSMSGCGSSSGSTTASGVDKATTEIVTEGQVTLLSSIPCPADRHRDKNVNLGHLEIAVCVRMLLFAHLH